MPKGEAGEQVDGLAVAPPRGGGRDAELGREVALPEGE